MTLYVKLHVTACVDSYRALCKYFGLLGPRQLFISEHACSDQGITSPLMLQ